MPVAFSNSRLRFQECLPFLVLSDMLPKNWGKLRKKAAKKDLHHDPWLQEVDFSFRSALCSSFPVAVFPSGVSWPVSGIRLVTDIYIHCITCLSESVEVVDGFFVIPSRSWSCVLFIWFMLFLLKYQVKNILVIFFSGRPSWSRHHSWDRAPRSGAVGLLEKETVKRAERTLGIRGACSLEWHHSPLEDYLYGGLSTSWRWPVLLNIARTTNKLFLLLSRL